MGIEDYLNQISHDKGLDTKKNKFLNSQVKFSGERCSVCKEPYWKTFPHCYCDLDKKEQST